MEKYSNIRAYAFESNLTIEQMRTRLNRLGPWRFVERDSDFWGEYTSSSAGRPGVASVTIINDEGEYVVNIKYKSTDPKAVEDCAKLWEELFGKILPAIGARNVRETDSRERTGYE